MTYWKLDFAEETFKRNLVVQDRIFQIYVFDFMPWLYFTYMVTEEGA